MSVSRCWAVVPAAGVGSRMQAERPKQYLPLHGRYLMDHTLETLLGYQRFEQLVVVLSEQDPYWCDSEFASDGRIIRAPGGSERCYSVLNGLRALQGLAAANDWVAVHDVAGRVYATAIWMPYSVRCRIRRRVALFWRLRRATP